MQPALTLPNLNASGNLVTVSQSALAHGLPQTAAPPILLLPAGTSGINAPASDATTVISVAEVFGYLRRHWLKGLIIALPLAAFTFAKLGLGRKVYEAEARLLLRIQDSNIFNFNEMSHASVTEVSAPMLVNNHRSELKARRFADYLYAQLDAGERAAFLNDGVKPRTWIDDVKAWLASPPPATRSTTPEDAFAKKLGLAARVEPLKDSFILRVQFRAGDPALAASMANHYVEDYIRYVADQELSTTRASSEFLDAKSAELRKRLQESEEQLASYRQSQGLVQDNEVKDVSSDRLRQLTQFLSDAQVKLTKAREDVRTIQAAQAAGRDPLDLKLVAENPDVVATRKLLDAKLAERAPLETWAGLRHPRMIAVNQSIEGYRQLLQRNINAVIAISETEAATIEKQIQELEQQREDARQDVLAQGGKNIQGNLLRDRVTTDREVYQKVVVRRHQADITGQFKDSGLLRVADIAVAPEKPVKPSKPVALLASIMVFGFCFFGLPVGLGFCEQQILPLLRRPTPPTAAPASTGTPPAPGSGVAAIPLDSTTRVGVLARLPAVKNATPTGLLAEFLRPASETSTSLGSLSTILDQRAPLRQGPGVILVTSAEPGEGKTAVSSALAAGLCSQGRRVFMIECNPESPTFSLLFPHYASHGTKTTDGFESLRYGTSNLYLLPSSSTPRYEQGELLETYRGWIEKARPEVDWIILDGSSVMRNFADVAPLLPLATDVVFVQDESRGTQTKTAAALNLLRPRMGETTFCGVVVNRGA